MTAIDFYWSCRSPYAYIACQLLSEECDKRGLAVALRPIYPLVLRTKERVAAANPVWVKYIVRDAPRVAEYRGLPFRWPKPDPLQQDMATLAVAEDQPIMHRLMRMAVAAERRGRGLAFARELGRIIFAVKNWDEGDHLRDAAHRAGLALADLERDILSDPDDLERELAANVIQLEAAGHWGVPTMVFNGEPFFGQDRLELLFWRLDRSGRNADMGRVMQ